VRTTQRSKITCRRCDTHTTNAARGLCHNCYANLLQSQSRLDAYPPSRIDRQGQVKELRDQGLTNEQIANRLGISKNAVALAARRSGAATPRPEAVFASRVPAPPEPGPCAQAPEGLFDISFGSHREVSRDGRLSRWIAPQVEDAFAYCARCPLATREWCVQEATLPHLSGVHIIAGGTVWVGGRPVWTLDDHEVAS
jgi:transposase-like protein